MECSYRDYYSNLAYSAGRVDTGEQPVYYKRPFSESTRAADLFEVNFKKVLLDPALGPQERKILKSFYKTYMTQFDNERQYGTLYGAVSYDELAYLELAGVSTYSRDHCYLVDLSECADVLLAFMSGDNALTVRDGMERVCAKYGVSYKLFSRALTTCEVELQGEIRIEMLYEVSAKVKNMCRKLYNSRKNLASSSRFAGVDIMAMSDVAYLQMVITSQMLIDMQYILNEVMAQYRQQRGEHGDAMLISKGLTHLLIESDNPNKKFRYDIDLGTVGTLEIIPYHYLRSEVHKVLLRGADRVVAVC